MKKGDLTMHKNFEEKFPFKLNSMPNDTSEEMERNATLYASYLNDPSNFKFPYYLSEKEKEELKILFQQAKLNEEKERD